MKKLLALLLGLLLIVPAPTVFASFDDQTSGARAPGMADAFTAVADDADAISYNPAGLIQLEDSQISTQYGELVKGLTDGSSLKTTYLGYALPLTRGYRTLGFAFNNYQAANLMNERTMIMSYGQRLDLERFGWQGIYSGGVNFKQLHRAFTPDIYGDNALNNAGVGSNQRDQLFAAGRSKDTYAFDLGGLAQFGPKYQYTAGIALINANQPDVSLAGDGDKAPLTFKAGLAYRPQWGTLAIESRRTQRLLGQTDSDIALGGERNIPFGSMGAIVLRGGYANGSRGYREITTGLSYMYARFRLDYAFSFPIGNLSDTTGTHHIGFSFKLGNGATKFANDYSNMDLLSAFAYDSLTSHVLITRACIALNLPADQRDRALLLLMRKYALDDPGLKQARTELREMLRRHSHELMEWPQLKFLLVKGLPDENRDVAGKAVEALIANNPKEALLQLSLLPVSLQRGTTVTPIALMALSELAAQSYRKQELDNCIDAVRRMVELLPTDPVVVKAYQDLMAQRAKITEGMNPSETPTLNVPEQVPEAPPTLVAPKPVAGDEHKVIKSDETLRAFGTALGFYMSRKAAHASNDELLGLLNQIKATYGASGIDMSLVDQEIEALQKAPAPAVNTPVKKPVFIKAPTKKPVKKPVVKKKPIHKTAPAKAPAVKPASSELERAWSYYKDAAARNISDHEKIELLQDMLRKHGDPDGRVTKELDRINRRLDQ